MKPAPRRLPSDFSYNPDTGDLRWAILPCPTVLVGDPVGHCDKKRPDIYTVFNRVRYTCVEIAHWLHTGQYSPHAKPIDGDWFNLKANNLRVIKPRYIRLQDDGKLRFIDGRFHIGPHRLKPKQELVLLAVKFRRTCTLDDLVEILWPDADSQPLSVRNNIAVHITKLNKMLKGCKISTILSCGNTTYRLTKQS